MVQETLVRAWDHLDSFQEGTNLRAWLFTILHNAYFSDLRRKRREVADTDGKKAAMLSVAPAQDGHLNLLDLEKAIALLPPDQREALMLVAGAGLSYDEVAKIARCPIGTVKSRANRARAKLVKILAITDQDNSRDGGDRRASGGSSATGKQLRNQYLMAAIVSLP